MPNTKSAKKRLKQSEKRRQTNKTHKSRLRTHLRRAREAIAGGDAAAAAEAVRLAASFLDRASKHGVIHENEARRRKSRLQRQLNSLSGQPAD